MALWASLLTLAAAFSSFIAAIASIATSMQKASLNYDLRLFFPTASLAVVPNYPGSWRISDRAPPITADKFSKVSGLQAALI